MRIRLRSTSIITSLFVKHLVLGTFFALVLSIAVLVLVLDRAIQHKLATLDRILLGGVIKGDMYHNELFQNPGHDNSWLTTKLIGKNTNRTAIGARIKVVTQGPEAQTIYRHVSTGNHFGANPLKRTIGIPRYKPTNDELAFAGCDGRAGGEAEDVRVADGL